MACMDSAPGGGGGGTSGNGGSACEVGYLLKIFTFTDGTGCTSELMLISFDADVDFDTRLLGWGTGLFFLVSSVDKVTLSLGLGIGSADVQKKNSF